VTPRVNVQSLRDLRDALDFAEHDRANGEPGGAFAAQYNRTALERIAPDLAADALALHDALARVTRERDAAVAARDALVTAAREYMDSSRAAAGDYLRATLADDHKAALADVDRKHSGRRLNATARLTALLDGAPADVVRGDVVRGDVVRAYLAAADALPGDLATINAAIDKERAARAALDAALLAAKGAP